MKSDVKAGGDPAEARREAIRARAERQGRTILRMMEGYETYLPNRGSLRGGSKPTARHLAGEMRQVRAAVAAMGVAELPVTGVEASHLRALLAAEAARPATARQRFGALSRFFDWLQEEGLVLVNPCLTVGRRHVPRPPPARRDHLDPAGIARLWHAAGTLEEAVHRDLARLLLTVPCRRGEATRMEWPHLDLGRATWSMPGALTKNRDPHRLHLHRLALEVLRGRWESAGRPKKGLVFASPRAKRPIDTFADIRERIDAAAAEADAERAAQTGEPASPPPPWRWHDMRRSFATALGEAGIDEVVVDAILNHRQSGTRGGVLGVYQLSRRWPGQVQAMDRWGEMLAGAIRGGGKVVQMAGR